jgi:hypothetical protein
MKEGNGMITYTPPPQVSILMEAVRAYIESKRLVDRNSFDTQGWRIHTTLLENGSLAVELTGEETGAVYEMYLQITDTRCS